MRDGIATNSLKMDVQQQRQLCREMECPICLKIPRQGPIYQCEHGHIICEDCRENFENCPICRVKLGRQRNHLLEK